jgi:hypothetical protein
VAGEDDMMKKEKEKEKNRGVVVVVVVEATTGAVLRIVSYLLYCIVQQR